MKKLIIPNSDKIGMYMIKKLIPRLSKEKLYAIQGTIENYPDSPEKEEITALLKKTFEKRKMKYD
jgi:hypothetical protein